MRNIPSSMDPTVVSAIDARLDAVEAQHRVRILWAIESGSRAWGFPGSDSDYDCRFLYVSSVEDYLGLRGRRDVIETPLDRIFDVNGWDVRKALGLMVKGNATAGEWLRSPIVYRGDAGFRGTLLELANDVVDPYALTNHYLHIAQNQLGLLESSGALKKFFYALRPAATLRWMRVRDDAVPPIELGQLLTESEADPEVRHATAELVDLKARTRELGGATIPAVLRDFVTAELAAAASRLPGLESARVDPDTAWKRADAVFLQLLESRE
ncbi:nucleotidyltransferase domain-containing protein [Myceligenerans crystallogenes]|uniref:Nucleotidyltransferase domain-containing protein n=1 Tax=Myceligenerans crystallogenes TaxID=316335 RepID=A0ABN2NAT1_9MICO